MPNPYNPFVPDAGSGGQLGFVPAPATGDKLASLRGGAASWSACGASVAASAAIANTDTIIKSSAKKVPANGLNVGDSFRVTLLGSCASDGSRVQGFNIYFGPLGTTADTKILTAAVTSANGTAAFRGIYEFTVRTIGAAGTVAGSLTLVNASATVGVAALNCFAIAATAAALDTTVASFISASYISGAAGATATFQNCIIEQI